jgi:Amt family ammonium transporter
MKRSNDTKGTHADDQFFQANRLARLRARLGDAEWRRYGYVLLGSKALAIVMLMMMVTLCSDLFGHRVQAADAALAGNDIVNPINTVWTLVAAFLVFGMQAGFTFLEIGFCRSREAVNVMMECVVDTCLCGLLFYAWGFAFMFGSGTPFFGTEFFFLQGAPATYGTTGVAFLAFWLFQYAFADTCSTITSGAMIGRTGFVGDLVYSVGVSGFIYPIIGHWAWGPDGWLALMGSEGHYFTGLGMGFHDFAGSTVVHTIGGFVALAGAIALGPRIGRKFKSEGGGPMLPHDLTVAAVGGIILWFGWYGFNPGSTLSAMDFEGIGRVATNTTLAACSAGLTAMLFAFPKTKTWDVSHQRLPRGPVAVTCPATGVADRAIRPAQSRASW